MNDHNDYLLCLSCVLPECNEQAPACHYYKPPTIEKKTQVERIRRQIAELEAELAEVTGNRKSYFRLYYLQNREKKLRASNERHAAIRAAKTAEL